MESKYTNQHETSGEYHCFISSFDRIKFFNFVYLSNFNLDVTFFRFFFFFFLSGWMKILFRLIRRNRGRTDTVCFLSRFIARVSTFRVEGKKWQRNMLHDRTSDVHPKAFLDSITTNVINMNTSIPGLLVPPCQSICSKLNLAIDLSAELASRLFVRVRTSWKCVWIHIRKQII